MAPSGARRAGRAAGSACGGRSSPQRSGSGGARAARCRPGSASAGRRRRRAGAPPRTRRAGRPRPARAPRPGSRAGRASPVVAAKPSFAFAANESGRGFSTTRAPSGSAPTRPGTFAITSSSSTCGASAGQRLLELARVAVRDRRRAETLTRAPRGRRRRCAARSSAQLKRRARSRPGGGERLALGDRAAHGVARARRGRRRARRRPRPP